MLAWREHWVARCRKWTSSVLPPLISAKMERGVNVHGPHFGEQRDPLAESLEEVFDLLHYLHAATSQRDQHLRVIERLADALQAHQKPQSCLRCTSAPGECSSVEAAIAEAREALEDAV